MKTRFLDSHPSGKEDLPWILLYSVMVHYLILYFIFGNPFQIVIHRDRGGSEQTPLDIELLSPNQVETNRFTDNADDPVFLPEEGPDQEDQIEVREKKSDPLPEDGMNLVESAAPLPPSPPKKTTRKAPPNMTGPQDCMLKLVGMVCPNGDFQCIEAYMDFCSNLPK